MKILIENELYSIELLQGVFDDPKFYKQNGLDGIITSVGYYHSFEKNSLVFMLPKVFMKDSDKTVFGCTKEELVDLIINESIKHKTQYNWVRQLSVHFYNSLLEFKKRRKDTSIIHTTETFELNTNIGNKEYSFLDLLLSFVNFYKKNKQQILFKHIEFVSNQAKKPKWEKTIRKSSPIFLNSKNPIYTEIRNKKKIINTEEELLTYFFSILNRLNKDHHLHLKIDKSFQLIEGMRFDRLCLNGSSKLRKIKHRYFNDTLKKMYLLCDMYFTQFDTSSIKRKREDFLAISNYNLVFEDMVDKLFSNKMTNLEVDGITIEKLKNNDDGKIIDHIYDYKSLIDTSDIFYIGDSKYYKSDTTAGKVSKYKQFTYAKNVIQFNIDLLNKNNQNQTSSLRYRDLVTEGYNISPNFFIYGYIDDVLNYDVHSIDKKGDPKVSFHFKDRLFDRDTLFVHQYKINFLFVLKAYSHFNETEIESFRKEVKETFRDNFVKFFNDSHACGFELYEAKFNREDYPKFVETHFKKLNGKCFCTVDNRLILAKHNSDKSIDALLDNFRLLKELD
ncbi:hypothetical protein [Flavobacterium sp.]|uniref:hypothetical protein n=1 Tax=Flavobacterium sp. TaxID=239 RepID=UPI00286B5CDA|nr:hypothetical protein [Flavobacterium sp.]